MEQYYKRKGRRFVKVDMPDIVDNSGKYYQKDGSFTEERTKDSIGLCIMSTPKEHIVMSLKTTCNGRIETAKIISIGDLDGYGEIPKLHELMTALILFREKLEIHLWEDIWAIHPITSATYAAYVGTHGAANNSTTSYANYVARLRSIIRIPQK